MPRGSWSPGRSRGRAAAGSSCCSGSSCSPRSAAVVGYAYFKGLPGIGGEPPLIRAEAGPYRRAPSDRGGLAVANANSSIVTRAAPAERAAAGRAAAAARDAPALRSPTGAGRRHRTPAVPATRPAAASTPVAAASDATAAATRTPTVLLPRPPCHAARSKPEPPEPAGRARARRADDQRPAAGRARRAADASPRPAPQQPGLPGAAAPRPAAARRSRRPSPSRAAPAEPRARAPSRRAGPRAAAPAPGPQRLVRAEPAAAPAPAPQPSATGAGIYRLQLAAVRSEGGLTQAWADLRAALSGGAGAVSPQVERTDTTSGPLFRLQAGPFANREAAANACGAIRGSGGQCFIVGPIAPVRPA